MDAVRKPVPVFFITRAVTFDRYIGIIYINICFLFEILFIIATLSGPFARIKSGKASTAHQ